VLQRLKETIDGNPWEDTAAAFAVTVSIGAATHVAGTGVATTIAAADRALYAAKAQGRDRIVVAAA
jgi:diguanylate cyclase (GGDEF)-like protein